MKVYPWKIAATSARLRGRIEARGETMRSGRDFIERVLTLVAIGVVVFLAWLYGEWRRGNLIAEPIHIQERVGDDFATRKFDMDFARECE